MEDSDYRLIEGQPPHQVPAPITPISPSNCVEARNILEKIGYAPDKRLLVTVSTRLGCRDAAVILSKG